MHRIASHTMDNFGCLLADSGRRGPSYREAKGGIFDSPTLSSQETLRLGWGTRP